MKSYPNVLNEFATVEALRQGKSIARFGDGEFKLCFGKKCVSQIADSNLQAELLSILSRQTNCLVGIPNINSDTPKKDFWQSYTSPKITSLLNPEKQYASSFITRPDSAPWIDTPEYWESIRSLWLGKDVTLVYGSENSLTPDALSGAKSVQVINVPAKNAYAKIDIIQEQISNNLVILCCGATATVLASRLCDQGKQAIDLGHVGMFLKSPGVFNIKRDELISPEYLEKCRAMHKQAIGWEASGFFHEAQIREFDIYNDMQSILDYGCGNGLLRKRLKENGFTGYIGEYDPAVSDKEILPKPADLVVCINTLEFVEPEKLDAVINHLWGLTLRTCFVVSTESIIQNIQRLSWGKRTFQSKHKVWLEK
jgi:hypothetical protein